VFTVLPLAVPDPVTVPRYPIPISAHSHLFECSFAKLTSLGAAWSSSAQVPDLMNESAYLEYLSPYHHKSASLLL
jgi:hypothetical protein